MTHSNESESAAPLGHGCPLLPHHRDCRRGVQHAPVFKTTKWVGVDKQLQQFDAVSTLKASNTTKLE